MFNYKMANELEYAILSGVLFFIVGNPITYGIVGNILKLNTKISKQNYILVFIHSIVMALLMFVTMWLLDTYFIEAEEAVEAAVEDVVEEVMGELRDPFDSEEYEIIKQKDGSTIVDGSIKIYDLEENLDIEFPDEREYDTLAGYILDFIGDIPDKGVKATYENYIFKVINIHSNRIDKVEVKTIDG